MSQASMHCPADQNPPAKNRHTTGEEQMDYKLISCDDHLDLNMLPADLWTSRMPEKFKERAPRVEERDGRAVWVCDGEVLGHWSGKRPKASGPKPVFTALDRGGIEDHTELRPGVAKLRLADMDRDG